MFIPEVIGWMISSVFAVRSERLEENFIGVYEQNSPVELLWIQWVPTGKVSLKGVFVYQTDYHLKRLGTACMHHCSSNG